MTLPTIHAAAGVPFRPAARPRGIARDHAQLWLLAALVTLAFSAAAALALASWLLAPARVPR